MKSICIKTNNLNLLNYIQNELKYIEIPEISTSLNEFKNYKNIIIHYKGKDNEKFIYEISRILSCLVIDELEEEFLKRIIYINYSYFNKKEQKHILELCYDVLSDNLIKYFDKKYNILIENFNKFLTEHHSIILMGFIDFRTKNYFKILEEVVDEAVKSYVIEKEYVEFISLLKLYVNSQKSVCNLVYIIYNNGNSILLDEYKNVIDTSKEIFKSKYLSDITFSSNDYTLNALLTILPKKIEIHLIDCNIDEFIHTLGMIFENRVKIFR